jgi:branched-chain amino acid transport system ATP-binding protein
MRHLETVAQESAITLVIVDHVFNIPTILKLASAVWTLSHGKAQINKAHEIKENTVNNGNHLHDLLRQIAGDKEKINTEQLPNGAKLTVVNMDSLQGSQTVLEVKDLVVKRGIRTVIDGLSLTLKSGHLYLLEAPNGWGKSSLLDVIAGIHPSESGSIILKGEEINPLPTHSRVKKGIAYLRSQQSVFTSLTVKEQRRLAKTDGQPFGNTLHGKTKGGNLSGGEKQKLSIEMLPESAFYLLDEPMVGLDAEAINRFRDIIHQMVRKENTIFITIPEVKKSRLI